MARENDHKQVSPSLLHPTLIQINDPLTPARQFLVEPLPECSMDIEPSDLIVGLLMAALGLTGLILASGAMDDGMYVFGLSLFGFACVFEFGLMRRHFDRREARPSWLMFHSPCRAPPPITTRRWSRNSSSPPSSGRSWPSWSASTSPPNSLGRSSISASRSSISAACARCTPRPAFSPSADRCCSAPRSMWCSAPAGLGCSAARRLRISCSGATSSSSSWQRCPT